MSRSRVRSKLTIWIWKHCCRMRSSKLHRQTNICRCCTNSRRIFMFLIIIYICSSCSSGSSLHYTRDTIAITLSWKILTVLSLSWLLFQNCFVMTFCTLNFFYFLFELFVLDSDFLICLLVEDQLFQKKIPVVFLTKVLNFKFLIFLYKILVILVDLLRHIWHSFKSFLQRLFFFLKIEIISLFGVIFRI